MLRVVVSVEIHVDQRMGICNSMNSITHPWHVGHHYFNEYIMLSHIVNDLLDIPNARVVD